MQATPFARRLGVELPIFSAPMGGGTARPALTAAVSNAGGCRLLGLGGVPAPAVPELITATRRRYGAGLLLPLLDPADRALARLAPRAPQRARPKRRPGRRAR